MGCQLPGLTLASTIPEAAVVRGGERPQLILLILCQA